MKILKFIGVMILVLALTLAVPFYYLNKKINLSAEPIQPLSEDISELEGLPKYLSAIVFDSEVPSDAKLNVSYIIHHYEEKIENIKADFSFLILIIGIFLGIFVTTTGIALKSTEKKLIGNAILTSGILTILAYIADYIIFIVYF